MTNMKGKHYFNTKPIKIYYTENNDFECIIIEKKVFYDIMQININKRKIKKIRNTFKMITTKVWKQF